MVLPVPSHPVVAWYMHLWMSFSIHVTVPKEEVISCYVHRYIMQMVRMDSPVLINFKLDSTFFRVQKCTHVLLIKKWSLQQRFSSGPGNTDRVAKEYLKFYTAKVSKHRGLPFNLGVLTEQTCPTYLSFSQRMFEIRLGSWANKSRSLFPTWMWNLAKTSLTYNQAQRTQPLSASLLGYKGECQRCQVWVNAVRCDLITAAYLKVSGGLLARHKIDLHQGQALKATQAK